MCFKTYKHQEFKTVTFTYKTKTLPHLSLQQNNLKAIYITKQKKAPNIKLASKKKKKKKIEIMHQNSL